MIWNLRGASSVGDDIAIAVIAIVPADPPTAAVQHIVIGQLVAEAAKHVGEGGLQKGEWLL